MVLLIDGAESCAMGDDQQRLLTETVTAARAVNIRTFVIGAPGSEVARGFLSELAFQGGTARSADCVHDAAGAGTEGDCHFDMTSTTDFAADLAAAFGDIGGSVGCSFAVDGAGSVNVQYTLSGAGGSTGLQPGGGGGGGATGASAGAPPMGAPACPATNLTEPCTCDDGSPGARVCVQDLGWQACTCGSAPGGAAGGGGSLVSTSVTPEANQNAAIAFEDYVTPTAGGDRKPGHYLCTFTCDYVGALSPDPFTVDGVVSFSLTVTYAP